MSDVVAEPLGLPPIPPALAPRLDAICSEPNIYTITRGLAEVIARAALAPAVSSILEIGAGRSSLVFASVLAHKGRGSLTSVDHAPEFCREAWDEITRMGVDAALVTGPLVRRVRGAGLLYSYGDIESRLAARGPYDLLFVDAPPMHFGRDCALHLAAPHLRIGALVVLDDAARRAEWTTVRRWLRQYPGLSVAVWQPSFERGIGVLKYERPGTRFSLRSFAGTFHDELQRIRDGERFVRSRRQTITVAP